MNKKKFLCVILPILLFTSCASSKHSGTVKSRNHSLQDDEIASAVTTAPYNSYDAEQTDLSNNTTAFWQSIIDASTTLAEDSTAEITSSSEVSNDGNLLEKAGDAIDGIDWSIENGVLTISGSGDMPQYDIWKTPWEDQKYHITSLVINEGVTSISNYAFDNFYSLETVSLPNSLKSIGTWAFQSCRKLKTISIPENVSSIGSSVFWGCDSLEHIYVADNNEFFTSENGALYAKDMSKIYCYPCKAVPSSLTLPKGLTVIGSSAFNGCKDLLHIEVPEGVKILEQNAFCGCESLKEIDLPSSLVEIDTLAFQNCSGITSLEIPRSVSTIEENAFLRCSSLESFAVASDNSLFCSVDGVIFNKDKTMLIAYPCGRYGEYIIPTGVSKICEGAFSWNDNLTSVTIPFGVEEIGDEAFEDNDSLVSITIPSSVVILGESLFSDCDKLETVVVPKSVIKIGYGCFSDSDNLTLQVASGSYAEQYAVNNDIPYVAE